MDLFERYLGAIESQLPEDVRADVMAELGDALMSDREAREAELGRPLTEDEATQLLKAFGHPLVVAGRYRRFNRLIGPEAFPFYWFALKVTLTLVMIATVIIGGIRFALEGEPVQALAQTIETGLTSSIAALGWVTLVFALIEYYGVTPKLAVWSPRHLPPPVGKPRKSRFDTAVEIAMGIVFTAWWTGNLGWTWLMDLASRGGSQALLDAGPAREALHIPVLALALAGIGVNVAELLRPGWNRLVCGLNLAWTAAGLVVLGAYVQMGPLVVASDPSVGESERLAGLASMGLGWLLAGITAIVLWEAARDVWWFLRNTRPSRMAQPRRNGA